MLKRPWQDADEMLTRCWRDANKNLARRWQETKETLMRCWRNWKLKCYKKKKSPNINATCTFKSHKRKLKEPLVGTYISQTLPIFSSFEKNNSFVCPWTFWTLYQPTISPAFFKVKSGEVCIGHNFIGICWTSRPK